MNTQSPEELFEKSSLVYDIGKDGGSALVPSPDNLEPGKNYLGINKGNGENYTYSHPASIVTDVKSEVNNALN